LTILRYPTDPSRIHASRKQRSILRAIKINIVGTGLAEKKNKKKKKKKKKKKVVFVAM